MTIPHTTDTWRKSSYSGGQTNCVEVAPGAAWSVRDTKDREGGTLIVPTAAWSAFTQQVRGK